MRGHLKKCFVQYNLLVPFPDDDDRQKRAVRQVRKEFNSRDLASVGYVYTDS